VLWHIQSVIETMAALAEPNRLRIVELLRAGARPVGDISERLHLQQPQVSKHLRVLKEAGLVEVEVRAQQRLYELRPEPLRELNEWLERFRSIWDARFDRLDDYLDRMKKTRKRTKKS
jgi:DNA-binding transcriptional ArsR family regulator